MPIVLDLPGTAGNKAGTPDSAALSITGDIDIRVKFATQDLTPASTMALISKFGVGPDYSWSLLLQSDGALLWVWSTNGSTTSFDVSTVQVFIGDISPREPGWVRVTHDVDNGASGNTITFYTSIDGTTWNQLGAAVVNSGTTSIFDSAADVTVGLRDDGGFPFNGQIYEAAIYNGIAGTLVADPDFHDAAQGWVAGDDAGDTGTDSQGNVWTLAGAATITAPEENIHGALVLLQAALGSNPFSTGVTWADLTPDLRRAEFHRGRQYELDRIEAGTMTVTLDNRSGDYDPENTAGAYTPNVKPMVPIRLRAVYDGTVYPLWQGFVERWPVSFPGKKDTLVEVQCVDLFKLLSLAQAALDNRTTAVDALSPVAWWRFADTSDETGTGHTLTFAGSPTAGGATGAWEGDTATTFDGSDDEATVASESDIERNNQVKSIEAWVRPTGTSGTDHIFNIAPSGGNPAYGFQWGGTSAEFTVFNGAFVTSATVGDWHHIVLTTDPAATPYAKVYVDGVLEFSGGSTVSEPGNAGATTVHIGSNAGIAGTFFQGDISEIAVYPTALTQAQVSSLYNASVEAFSTQLTSARIAYLLDNSSVIGGGGYTLQALETGQTTMSGANSPTSGSLLDLIEDAVDTELGIFFMGPDGYATFHDRHYRTIDQATAAHTFGDVAAGNLGFWDLGIGFDDELIYNDIRVKTTDAGDPVVATDLDSQTSYGIRTLSKTTYPDDQNEGYDFAHYLKGFYSEPKVRINWISFRLGDDTALWAPVLGGEISTRYRIRKQLGGDDLDKQVYLESISHSIDVEGLWEVTWELSPADTQQFWLLGVAGLSELGETTRLGY